MSRISPISTSSFCGGSRVARRLVDDGNGRRVDLGPDHRLDRRFGWRLDGGFGHRLDEALGRGLGCRLGTHDGEAGSFQIVAGQRGDRRPDGGSGLDCSGRLDRCFDDRHCLEPDRLDFFVRVLAIAPGSHVGLQEAVDFLVRGRGSRLRRDIDRLADRLNRRLHRRLDCLLVLGRGFRDRGGQGHPVDPAHAPVGAPDSPVDAVPLQEMNFVAAIENADLGGTDLIRAVQQSNQAIPDLTALVALRRPDARRGERHGRGLGDRAKRIGPADLLQRRSAPARQLRFVDGRQPPRAARVHPGGRGAGEERIGRGIVSIPAAPTEDHRTSAREGTSSASGDARNQLAWNPRSRSLDKLFYLRGHTSPS
jgi:hypothetical protein